MVYKITFDSFTKINEQAGTIQNVGDYIIEMSESPTFDSGILILPNQKSTFNNTDIYLRCIEQGFSSEVRIVPFILDAKGGDVSSVDTTALKSVALVGNALNFYTSSDTAQTAAYSIDIPAEQFIDQAATTFVPNFYFSAILYPNAINPNLNGKPVFVLGVKTKSNDGLSNTVKYSFIDVSKLVDTYVASDTSVTVSDYKFKVNISPDAGNYLRLKDNGLFADTITDTATSSVFGLTKLYGTTGANTDGTLTQAAITAELAGKLDSDATAVAAFKDSSGNVITDTYVTKSELSHKLGAVRYGYRIRKDEADPDLRVEYLYDAAGMRPAHMVWDTDTATAGTDSDTSYFDYGDWQSVWFVRDNKPCMLKYDGSVDYYLDPNDYSKRETPLEVVDGTDTVIVTDTDVSNTSYNGNAMAQFPLVWVKRYEDDNYLYEIVSNVQWDENYKAYAHTDKDGNIKDYFYISLFGASGNSSKLRSLSGKRTDVNLKEDVLVNAAKANGSNWSIFSWSQHELIRTLLLLISKSCDGQSSFGKGNERQANANDSSKWISSSGTLYNKGQFFGFNDFVHQMKIFHIEEFWGNAIKRCAGATNINNTVYIKMTPEGSGYRVGNSSGYSVAGYLTQGAYISKMSCNEFGMLPTEWKGSTSTYFCDLFSNTASSVVCDFFTGSSFRSSPGDGGLFSVQAHLDSSWTGLYAASTFLAYV